MRWHGSEEQHCWANMPHELLREVLRRVDESESLWPRRRSVVACAQVCRTWRHVANDVVQPPQLSSRITFPISLKQPGPRNHLFQCYIKRNPDTQTYKLFLGLRSDALLHDGKFLLAAREYKRPTCTDYIISIDPHHISKRSNACIGKLRSNFLRTKFRIYDHQLPYTRGANIAKSQSNRLANLKRVSPRAPARNYPVAHISYEFNMLGPRGPRRMHCIMDSIPASAIEPGLVVPERPDSAISSIDKLLSSPFFGSKSNRVEKENFLSGPMGDNKDDALVLKNKAPRWHEQMEGWYLNFNGRVMFASVKNFQLVASPIKEPAGPGDDGNIILQFGKVDKDLFIMDYRYPISAFQAFAICLSSFETKIGCE